MTRRFTVFRTSLGTAGALWTERGVAGVCLPLGDESRVRAHLRRRSPGAELGPPPPGVSDAIDGIVSLLEGEPRDLAAVALDLAGVDAFDRRVYDAVRAVPPGSTVTYGELAARVGEPRGAREVGAALGRNPCPLIVPCHRVLAADGRPGGFSAPGGVETKLRLLGIEGVSVARQPRLFA